MKQYKGNRSYNQIAEIELTYKPGFKLSETRKVTGSMDVYKLLLECWEPGKIDYIEQCNVLLLNRAHRILGILKASTGGVTGTVVDPKVILGAALKANATSLILSHNHPSGNLQASPQDIKLTEKIQQGAALLDMKLLDHLIVTAEGYLSFAEEGLL